MAWRRRDAPRSTLTVKAMKMSMDHFESISTGQERVAGRAGQVRYARTRY